MRKGTVNKVVWPVVTMIGGALISQISLREGLIIIALGIVAAVLEILWHYLTALNPRRKAILLVTFGICAFGAAASLIWLLTSDHAAKASGPAQTAKSAIRPQADQSLDVQDAPKHYKPRKVIAFDGGDAFGHARTSYPIDLKCVEGTLPTYVPSSGGYNSVFLFSNGHDIQFNTGQVTIPLPPGTKLPTVEGSLELAVVCTITNFGNVPIFSFKLEATVELRQAVTADGKTDGRMAVVSNGVRSGPTLLSVKKTLFIDRLDNGPDHAYTVYFQCSPPNFVHIEFANFGRGKPLGEQHEMPIPLIPPTSEIQHSVFVTPPIRRATS